MCETSPRYYIRNVSNFTQCGTRNEVAREPSSPSPSQTTERASPKIRTEIRPQEIKT